ncbi:MAG: hypothetical protein IH943_06060 [Acidobacteria bacterium]|nr:hypothetical protein [Acidobacteriota bacterium]
MTGEATWSYWGGSTAHCSGIHQLVEHPDLRNTVSHQSPEETSVDRVRRRVENVSGGTGLDQIGRAAAGERLAQIGDVDLNGVLGRTRRIVPPNQVDDPVGRDDLVCVEKKDGEDGALLRRAQVDRAVIRFNSEWTQQSEFD